MLPPCGRRWYCCIEWLHHYQLFFVCFLFVFFSLLTLSFYWRMVDQWFKLPAMIENMISKCAFKLNNGIWSWYLCPEHISCQLRQLGVWRCWRASVLRVLCSCRWAELSLLYGVHVVQLHLFICPVEFNWRWTFQQNSYSSMWDMELEYPKWAN